ncbi:CRTAC1 family protein [Neptunicoccus cionae]|uniref:CRTAC1 family protein n=1 Tax=Neptunicoccus cionae TaxID=2035344 RepID=UPI001E6184CD|nr:CRTAC1 family protein [Amylibacter cionae]
MPVRPELLILLALVAAPVASDPVFRPVTVPAHIYAGGWEHFVGGGVAVLDCDQDGYPDLYVAGGQNPARLLRNTTAVQGTLGFVPLPLIAAEMTDVTGAYPLDINSDGWDDLVVLRVGENYLLQGGPDCAFTPFEDLSFQDVPAWTTAFSATWESGAELPTLAFGNYVDRQDPSGPFEACDTNYLYRPEGGSYGAPIPLTPGLCPLSMLFSDWSRSGRADLRFSNDRHYYVKDGQEQLLQMAEIPRFYTGADGWQAHKLWGMGIASRDLTGDGLPDVMMTSMGDQRLQIQDGDGTQPRFVDARYDLGTTAHRPFIGGDGRPSTGWHVQFGDVQNDGRDDIFIAKGNVEQMPGLAMQDPNNLLVQDENGTFTETAEAAGVASLHRGRGGALVDLDRDGLLDLVVVNRRVPLEIYRNETAKAGRWTSLRLSQAGANKDAVGAWIEVKAGRALHSREITVGGGHAGGQRVPEHFGLGTEAAFSLRVIWPDGTTSDWTTLSSDAAYVIRADGTRLAVAPD